MVMTSNVLMKKKRSKLPTGWVNATIDELMLDFQSGFASGKKNIEGGVKHLRMNNVSSRCTLDLTEVRTVPPKLAKEQYILQSGDVLFCHTNSTKLVGKTAFFNLDDNGYTFSNHLTRLKVSKEGPIPPWIWLVLSSLWQQRYFENRCKKWVNQAAIPKEILLSTNVPLPPLEEQKRIIKKVEKLFEESRTAREALDKIPPIMKKFRQSVLELAYKGKLVTQNPNDESAKTLLEKILNQRKRKWEDELKSKGKDPKKFKYEKPKQIETIELPKLHSGWIWTTLEEITENHDGKRIPVSKKEREKMQGKYPYYGASGIIDYVNDFLFIGSYLLVAEDGANLLSRSMPIAFLAHEKFWVNNHAHILTTRRDVPLEYLSYFLNSIDVSKWITGTAQPKLNQKRMNSIPIPLPPLEEQKRIVKKIEGLFSFADQIKKSVKEAKNRADKIDQSILSKAFRGELVPQDPNDEPALQLLEKIKTSKVELTSKLKKSPRGGNKT